jgi:hypothetical protein
LFIPAFIYFVEQEELLSALSTNSKLEKRQVFTQKNGLGISLLLMKIGCPTVTYCNLA